MLLCKLGKTGCVKSSFLWNPMPCCPVLSGKYPVKLLLAPLSRTLILWNNLWPCLTDVRVITTYIVLDWPDRLATKFSSEEMAKPHRGLTGSAHTCKNTQKHAVGLRSAAALQANVCLFWNRWIITHSLISRFIYKLSKTSSCISPNACKWKTPPLYAVV